MTSHDRLVATKSTDVALLVGRAMAKMGRLEDAILMFETVTKMPDGTARAQYELGCVQLRRGNRKEALAHFRQATNADRYLVDAFFELGMNTINAVESQTALVRVLELERQGSPLAQKALSKMRSP